MIRRIITIDRDKCNGCGLCAGACHEGAIGIVDGKAALLREDYCDGLGDFCLPVPPGPSPLKSGRHLPTTRQRYWLQRGSGLPKPQAAGPTPRAVCPISPFRLSWLPRAALILSALTC